MNTWATWGKDKGHQYNLWILSIGQRVTRFPIRLHLAKRSNHFHLNRSNSPQEGIQRTYNQTKSFRSALFLLKLIGKLAKRINAEVWINAMKRFPGLAQNLHILQGVLVNRGWVISVWGMRHYQLNGFVVIRESERLYQSRDDWVLSYLEQPIEQKYCYWAQANICTDQQMDNDLALLQFYRWAGCYQYLTTCRSVWIVHCRLPGKEEANSYANVPSWNHSDSSAARLPNDHSHFHGYLPGHEKQVTNNDRRRNQGHLGSLQHVIPLSTWISDRNDWVSTEKWHPFIHK